jgi:hypothetical protein
MTLALRLLSLLILFLPLGILAQGKPASCTPKGVETTLLIHASPQAVWDELIRFEQYAEWHPYLRGVEGKFRKGRYLHFATIEEEGGEGKFTAKVLDLQPAKSLEWGGSALFFFRAKHYFHLVPQPDGSCLLVQGEYWKGLFGKRFGRKVYEKMCGKFQEMNARLAQRVE